MAASIQPKNDEDTIDLSRSLIDPIPTSIGLEAFSWFSALAWITTGDRSFTKDFHNWLSADNPTFAEAERTLNDKLAQRSPSRRRDAKTPDWATDALESALHLGAVQARGLSDTKQSTEIHSLDWLDLDHHSSGPHNSVRDHESGRTAFTEVQISEVQTLARWPESLHLRLRRLEGPTWSLSATAYWVQKRSHRGFRKEDRNFPYPDWVLDEIRTQLTAGKLICRASMKDKKAEFEVVEPPLREKDFWLGHSLREVYWARFDCREVQKIWPICSPEDYSRFESQNEYVAYAMSLGMTKREAWTIAHANIRPAKRGPNKRK